MKSKKPSIFFLIFAVLLTLSIRNYNLSNKKIINPLFSGSIMGTTYNVKIIDEISLDYYEEINSSITNLLNYYNNQMSTWIDDSEINKFNKLDNLNPYDVDAELYKVVSKSLKISELSDGYYDPTIQPLYDLWGFGSGSTKFEIDNFPDGSLISNKLHKIGFKKIIQNSENYKQLQKKDIEITLNLGGIAKGSAADRIIFLLSGEQSKSFNQYDFYEKEILPKYKFKNIYADIGGDVSVIGTNQDGLPWRIGVQMPSSSLFNVNNLYGLISITNGSFATSGNYYNFKEKDNKKYAHILNPKNGMAIETDIVSVSVYHPDGAFADGLATAIYAMGIEKGLKMMEKIDGETLIIKSIGHGNFEEYFSSNFIKKTNFKKVK